MLVSWDFKLRNAEGIFILLHKLCSFSQTLLCSETKSYITTFFNYNGGSDDTNDDDKVVGGGGSGDGGNYENCGNETQKQREHFNYSDKNDCSICQTLRRYSIAMSTRQKLLKICRNSVSWCTGFQLINSKSLIRDCFCR